jgi:decaprenyl-phosphate phosphoribosyltransferase
VIKIRALIKLLRPRQWIKNAFVLAPLVFTGKVLDAQALTVSFTALLLFCLASSLTYVINDLRDVEADRNHPLKSKSRPIAAGEISVRQAQSVAAVLFLSLVLLYPFAPEVIQVIALYLVINLAYSFRLKHMPVIDIFCIASGFVLRVFAGAVALAVPVSGWMFVTTFSLALFLAAIKRRQELVLDRDGTRPVLESYTLPLITRFAEMAAVMAIVAYSLFAVTVKPELVYSVPLVLFGIFRYWYLVEIFDIGESPTDALLADTQLQVVTLLWAAFCIWQLSPVLAS